MPSIEALENRLKALTQQITETKKRLPAHSIKPPVMIDLLALEDEYDEVTRQLKKMKGAL